MPAPFPGTGRPPRLAETFLDGRVTQHCGDVRAVLASLPADHFDCVVTSPPYWGLRDYGTARWEGGDPDCDHRSPTMREGRNEERAKLKGSAATNSAQLLLAHRSACGKCGAIKIDEQLGLEPTLGEHLAAMVDVFRAVRSVLKPSGTLWLNYGDCYATSPNGRSAADTKAAGNDDRTFRDKPFSTIGAIYQQDTPELQASRRGRSNNPHDRKQSPLPSGRIVAGDYLKAKDLCMVPNRLAIALQDDGYWVRSENVWSKSNPMPDSSGRYRPSTSHEKVFLLAKEADHYYNFRAVMEPLAASSIARLDQDRASQIGSTRAVGKANDNMKAVRFGGNKKQGDHGSAARPASGNEWAPTDDLRLMRNVWFGPTEPFSEAHFATMPSWIAERCIKAGCPPGGSVLDIFGGAGTTALAAVNLGRTATLIDLNPEYCTLARARIEAAFMGKDEGRRHMTKATGKIEAAGPLFEDRP